MMQILIIEDEIPARNKLKRFLEELNIQYKVIAEVDTVTKGILILKNSSPDLIIADIELLDGNVFEIFASVTINCPIIFTTAYDRFWMNAFENNGIDYLMKPFSKERFQKAWSKYLLLRTAKADQSDVIASLTKFITSRLAESTYKKRFTIHTSKGIHFLETESIVYIEATEGVVFAFDKTGKKHILNFQTLKELELHLNPSEFFRLNRSQVICRQYIEKLDRVSKNTLAVKMKGYQELLVASQSNTPQLREWIDQ